MASKRQANFELLRIVAILMIITLHYLVKGNVAVPYEESQSGVNLLAWLLEAFCIVAVNCFCLVSGYFLVESVWKPGRVVSLLAQILFYSIAIPAAMLCVGMISPADLSVYDWVNYILPIETEHYWFATAYIMMYLFAPILAAGVRNMEQKMLQKVIVVLLLFLSVGKSIFPIPLITDKYGYDSLWFLCLFLIAAYLRLYGCQWLESRKHSVCLYIGMCLCCFGTWFLSSLFAGRIAAFAYYADMPYTYNHIFVLLGSVGLFMAFKNIRIKEGKFAEAVRRLAPYTFGVYLVHEHLLVRYEWGGWMQIGKVRDSLLFLPHMMVCVAVVYLVGTIIDFVRAYLFVWLKQAFVRRKQNRNEAG